MADIDLNVDLGLVSRAALFAAKKHMGQFRKYKNAYGLTEPYIIHPARIAGMVAHAQDKFNTHTLPTAMAAAWCHDVVEDCEVSIDTLVNETSDAVGSVVTELTNPSKQRPDLRRAERKKMDREHLASVGREAKILKMFDRMDNISGLINAPHDFAKLYLDESQLLAEAMWPCDRDIFNALTHTINAARKFFDRQGSST